MHIEADPEDAAKDLNDEANGSILSSTYSLLRRSISFTPNYRFAT